MALEKKKEKLYLHFYLLMMAVVEGLDHGRLL
jgi:hypothetical protein